MLIIKFYMFEIIKNKCAELILSFDKIDVDRQKTLLRISEYIQRKLDVNKSVNLIFICTHNSRRSHFGQIWATVAANYFGVKNVNSFSGGTEATAFNLNAINALKSVGFQIECEIQGENPLYKVKFNETTEISCFSKVYNHITNPSENFSAVMTCSEAEENCPYIPGAEFRISTTYQDPKKFDDTSLQKEKYLERCNQIGLECLFIFSQLKTA